MLNQPKAAIASSLQGVSHENTVQTTQSWLNTKKWQEHDLKLLEKAEAARKANGTAMGAQMVEEGKNFGYTALVSRGAASKPADWHEVERFEDGPQADKDSEKGNKFKTPYDSAVSAASPGASSGGSKKSRKSR